MINVTTETIVTAPTDTREATRLGLLAVNAQLILFWGQHTLPTPTWLLINTYGVEMRFGSREALDAWFAALGPRAGWETVSTQPYEHNGQDETLHNAYCQRWGWNISLSALTPAWEVPEQTLTSVEREALARATEAGQTLYDATVEDAPAAHECAPVPDTGQVLAALADKAAEAGAE